MRHADIGWLITHSVKKSCQCLVLYLTGMTWSLWIRSKSPTIMSFHCSVLKLRQSTVSHMTRMMTFTSLVLNKRT